MGRAVLVLTVATWAVAAHATTLLRLDVEQLTQASDVVVRGTVKSVKSRWSADHLRILTDVELSVAESLKGSAEQAIIVTQPGGVVGDIGQRVSGLAAFTEGEEVVLFLTRRAQGRYDVAGMAQGKYRVERSADGTATYALPESTGEAELIEPSTGLPVPSNARPLELSALRQRVHSAARAGGAR